MEKAQQDVILTIIISSIVFVILAVFTTLFFLVFVRKKRIINEKKEELSRNFEQQLLQTKFEIQNQTLAHISREIHDNLGQILSFVKLSLSTSAKLNPVEKDEKIGESIQLISEVINDLRDLSKSMSVDKINKEGLAQVILNDAERLSKSEIVIVDIKVSGTPVVLPGQTDIVLYRLFQEIVNNSLKHSGSETIQIHLKYEENFFILNIKDSGKGFDEKALGEGRGLGLENIKQRASLIGATVNIETKPLAGCNVSIFLNTALP